MVACVCNLKPAKMRGVESFAMVLAAGTDRVELVTPPQGSKVGERLTVDGMGEPQPDEVLKSKSQQKVHVHIHTLSSRIAFLEYKSSLLMSCERASHSKGHTHLNSLSDGQSVRMRAAA